MSGYGLEEPACWSWEVPLLWSEKSYLAAQMDEQKDLPEADRWSEDALALVFRGAGGAQRLRFSEFHAGRCACCGISGEHLVEDHEHWSGLVRGLLCRNCNIREGRTEEPLFLNYRKRCPAVILKFRSFYVGRGWNHCWWADAGVARKLTGNPNWHSDIKLCTEKSSPVDRKRWQMANATLLGEAPAFREQHMDTEYAAYLRARGWTVTPPQ